MYNVALCVVPTLLTATEVSDDGRGVAIGRRHRRVVFVVMVTRAVRAGDAVGLHRNARCTTPHEWYAKRT